MNLFLRIKRLVGARRLTAFVVLAYVLSWWSWLIPAWHLPIFPPGPFIAAWLVLRSSGARDAARTLLTSLVRWRVSARAAAFVFVAPLLLVALTIGIAIEQGAAWPNASRESLRLLLLFPVLLIVPAAGGAWSEPGFRGYALPRLLERCSPLVATLVLGSIVSLWHLPLVVAGRQPVADLVWIVAWSFLFTQVARMSLGSVFAAMLLHAWDDTLVNFAKSLFVGDDLEQLSWIHVVVYAAAAVVLIAVAPRTWSPTPDGRRAANR